MIGNIAAGLYGIPTTPVTNSFESIATITVGAGGQSSIDFTSIPSTYKHLQIRGIGRNASATTGLNILKYRFNADSGSNYTSHSLYGTGAAASATNTTGSSFGWFSRTSLISNNSTTNVFGGFIIEILDYASTSKNRTTRTLAGVDINGTGAVELTSSVWLNSTTAINQITLYDEASANFTQYSSFALYGIKDS